jgi:hypothetical protein
MIEELMANKKTITYCLFSSVYDTIHTTGGMMKDKKIGLIIFLAVIILISAFLLVILSQTVLFTWSPVRFGYNRFHFDSYNVYTKSHNLEQLYTKLDDIIIQNENQHELTYTIKPEIIICKKSDLLFYLPWIGPHNASGIGPKTVYLSTYAINKYRDPRSFIKHELSHILLLQNYGNFTCMSVWKNNEWLPEGFAVYVTDGFPGHITKNELLSKMKEYGIYYTKNTKTILAGKKPGDVHISVRYKIYYYFIAFLIENYNKDTFISFLHSAFDNPAGIMDTFHKHYNSTFTESLIHFYGYLNNENKVRKGVK